MTLTFAFDPVIAQWGPFQLGWHGIFTALAVMVALWLAGRLAMQRGIPSEVVYGITGWGIAGVPIWIRGRCWTPRPRPCWLARESAASVVGANGDAWGADATGCPFRLAIRYTNQNDLLPANLRSVPTYASPLYEIAAEALLLATVWLFRDRLRQRPGLTFLVGSIVQSTGDRRRLRLFGYKSWTR